MLSSLCYAYEIYQVTRFNHSSGLYFEFIDELQFYTKEQNVITFLNLNTQDKKYTLIKKYCLETESLVKQLNDKFDTAYYETFKSSINQFKSNLILIDSLKLQLNQLLGHRETSRVKRGWFDFVGMVSKRLFGIMDSEDAEFIDGKINAFEKSEHILASIIKEQSQVVRSTIINFNNTVSAINRNEKILKDNIDKIRDLLISNPGSAKILSFELLVEDHFLIISHLTNSLKSDYDILISAVLFAKKGILHPSIISPIQLRDNLLKLTSYVPHGLHLPIPPNEEDSFLLLDIIEITSYFYNSKLVFIIKLPLLPTNRYEVYRLVSLPLNLYKNTYTFVNPSKEILIIGNDQQKFKMFQEADLNKCRKFVNILLCVQTGPLLDTQIHRNCETRLFSNQPVDIIHDCDTRVTHIFSTLWSQLQHKNSWIFATNRQRTVTINCRNNPSDIIDVFINGSGILSLNEDCIAYSESTILEPSKIFTSTIERDFSPDLDMISTLRSDEIIKKINVSSAKIHLNLMENILKTDDLRLASFKLKDMENLADTIITQQASETKVNVLIYIMASIIAVIILYYTSKCICKFFKNDQCCKSICQTCPPITINNRVENTTPVRSLEYLNDNPSSHSQSQQQTDEEPRRTRRTTRMFT